MSDEVRSIRRALGLIRLMNERETWMLQELCERSGLPKATLSRILHTLEKDGYVFTPPAPLGSYRLTSQTRALSAGVGRMTTMADVAQPIIMQGTLDLDWPISFAVPEVPFMRILACGMPYLPAHSAKSTSIGRRHWVFSSAVGNAYLSSCSDEGAMRILEAATAFCQDSSMDLPIPPPKAALQAAEKTRKSGYALRIASQADVNSTLAVPVVANGAPIGALACSTFPKLMTAKFIASMAEPLHKIAAQLGDAYANAE